MRNAIVLGLALASLSVVSCKGLLKKREPDPSATQAPAAPALPAATPAPAVEPPKTVSDDGIPTPEDFEDEAFEKVTAATYTSELERLKKDIGK